MTSDVYIGVTILFTAVCIYAQQGVPCRDTHSTLAYATAVFRQLVTVADCRDESHDKLLYCTVYILYLTAFLQGAAIK